MTKASYVLVFDLGTTSVRTCIIDAQGQIQSKSQKKVEQIYPKPGWVEQDPKQILQLCFDTANEALNNLNITWQYIASIGITNQRETVILWDKETGEPVYNAIVWQCRRTTDFCQQLKSAGHEAFVHQKTGLVLDPYFSASKIRWIMDNCPQAKELLSKKQLLFGTVDCWLLWHLTGKTIHATDYTNASRTLLFNILDLKWDEELLDLFGVSKSILPTVFPSKTQFGKTDASLTDAHEIPITAVIGDQHAALYGQKCWNPGQAKCTYGTGAFLMLHTGNQPVFSKNGMLTTLSADSEGNVSYALEGAIFIAGGAIEWLQKKMKCFEHPSEIDTLAQSLSGNDHVYFVPAFTGLGAPYWNANVRGTIVGLTQDSGPAHLVRAALEAMAYQTREVLEAMLQDAELAEVALNLENLRVDGGVTRSDFLLQYLADMLQIPMCRTDDAELTAKGAGYLAGLAVGFWKSSEDILNLPETLERRTPGTLLKESDRNQFFAEWHQAIKKAIL